MGHRYELPIASFVSVVLVLLPLPWHWKARNVATLSLIAWLVVCNLIRGINSIIWMDNVAIHYKIWCDISTKLLVGVSIALPACSFTLTRHLEHVASARYVTSTAADKKRRRILEVCFTVGIPTLIMALHYIVQGHRFDIIEDIGCQPVTYSSVIGLVIINVPGLILSIGSLIYATLALRHFAIRRMQFEQHLKDSKSALTTARYMRLMALALTEMLWGTSLGSFIIFDNVRRLGLRPWTSWADVHYDFGRIALYPNFLTPDMGRLLLSWWIVPCTAIIFFLFFGFSDEAREGYATLFAWIRRTVFRRKEMPAASLSSIDKIASLPRYRGDFPSHRKRLSLDEISIDFASLKRSKHFLPPSYSSEASPSTPREDMWEHVTRPGSSLAADPSRIYNDDHNHCVYDVSPPPSPPHALHHDVSSPSVSSGIHVSTIRETR